MSKLFSEFNEYIAEQRLDSSLVHTEQGEGFILASFPDGGGDGAIYNVAIVFYDNDDDVEIYIRKLLEGYDRFQVLEKLNELNAKYSRNTFLIDDDVLTVKGHLFAHGELMLVLRDMATAMQVAKLEFPAITQ